MSKQSLLLVDGDTRSLRVLEVSLRKAGFMVTAATSVNDALDKLELHAPDLIISETTFPDGDGFELRRRVRATPEWSEIPFIFLTAEAAIENKIRGLELGVDDYLTKPIYIKEIVTRINILLQKRQRVRFEERRDGRTRFAGRVQDMPVVDVIQTIEISRKSGVIQFVGERGRQAAIYFRDGRVIDAESGSLQGEDAVYRLLTWGEGEFEVVFRTVRRREVITMSSQALLMEGMRRLDEWSRLFEQLPPLTHRFEVDTIELAARLGDVPDDNNRILRLFDGKRTLLEVIDASDVGDLECLQAISRLYFEELLLDLDHERTPRRDTGKSIPLVEIDGPAPVTDESSGPVTAPPVAHAIAATADLPTEAGERSAEAPPADEDSDAVDDADADQAERRADQEPVGPLMGGYRPSSLRLIDEAVAAAQAIEPTLFDEADTPLPEPDERHTGNGVSRRTISVEPTLLDDDGPGSDGGSDAALEAAAAVAEPRGPEAAGRLRLVEREDSGLRMIGSLGRDRAEASGELATMGHSRPLRSETARELVTILPRRITRELPIVTQELAESLPTPTPTSPVLVPRPVSASEAAAQAAQSQRIALPGSGVRAPSRSRRFLRIIRSVQDSGPGLGAMLLILLAAVLAGTAVLLRLRRHVPRPQTELLHDAPVFAGDHAVAPDPTSAAPAASGTTSAAPAASIHRSPAVAAAVVEATVATIDAGAGPADAQAGEATPGPGSGSGAGTVNAGKPEARPAGIDRVAEARALCDQASSALDQGDFAHAFELAASALKLRRTARGYLLRARAEQRLGRVGDALSSLDAATEIAPNVGTVWEQRGRVLWAARRRDEARVAFERFLELDPGSPRAPEVLHLLNEPR